MALGLYATASANLVFVMRIKSIFLTALPAALLLFAACGDGADTPETPTPEPTVDPLSFGEPPVLGGNILEISPAHAEQVTRAATITRNELDPKGVCVKVSFTGLPTFGQAFRFIIDETEVTAAGDTVWVIATNESPKDGRICYAPEGGIPVGRHTAAIAVQDPNNTTGPYKQIVDWKFEVTE
jgi:hypothetical protein